MFDRRLLVWLLHCIHLFAALFVRNSKFAQCFTKKTTSWISENALVEIRFAPDSLLLGTK